MSSVLSMDPYRIFLALQCADSNTEFAAVSLSSHRRDFLAKAPDGSPVFLLHDSSAENYSPSIALRHLSVQFHSTCRVRTNDETLDGQFAVVTCDASVPDLYELFIRCFAAAVERLPVSADTSVLEECVHGLLNLFRALSQPNNREVAGLWAELYVITCSSNISRALAAWHADKFDRFDFSWSMGCLEVKATAKESRVHEFSLEQLMEPVNGHGFLASVLLQPLSGGIGVMDLARKIEEAVSGEPLARQKLWENVASALGSEFSDRLDRRFDLSYAERHLVMYAMGDVPKPNRPSDTRITGIRFKSDLSQVSSSLAGDSLEPLRRLFD